ncbi:MAG: hypothetical protein PHT07_20450 [Paludibacter sp.]|nr:hypothetical protein [Paludibacter sp.]
MNTDELKLKIFNQLNLLNAKEIKDVYRILQKYIKSQKVSDDWINVSEVEKQGIKAALKEINAGKGIPHELVMSRLRHKHDHI